MVAHRCSYSVPYARPSLLILLASLAQFVRYIAGRVGKMCIPFARAQPASGLSFVSCVSVGGAG